MGIHEEKARELKAQGKLCSDALHTAFAEDTKVTDEYPAPRSIDGKCGALLTALKILEDLGYGDKKEEFEKEFLKRFGYVKCMDLIMHGKRCADYVGECARMIDEIIQQATK